MGERILAGQAVFVVGVLIVLLCAGFYQKGHLNGLAAQAAQVTALRQNLNASTARLDAANTQILNDAGVFYKMLTTFHACAKIVVDDAALPREPELRVSTGGDKP